jgi:hypothetical protein
LLEPALSHREKLVALHRITARQGTLAGFVGVPVAVLAPGIDLMQHWPS